jgi:putative ABC transport system permease protein
MPRDDLDRELQSHLDPEAEDRRDAGLSADAAREAALRTLGNQAWLKEDVRARAPLAAIDDLLQDLRYGLRMLRRHPGFTIVAALTLALGIGANTAMFSVVEAVLLRPLPYPAADRLVMVWENVNLPAYKNDRNTPSPGNFNDWRRQATAFSAMAAIGYRAWNLTGAGDPTRIDGEAVSAGLFSVLGVDAALGRTFTDEEDQPGGPKVVVLGHGLWTDRFGSDRAIVGRKMLLDDTPYTIVGVMPRGFAFPDPDDRLWIPIGLTPEQLANHGSHFLRVVARLKPGATLAQAQAEIDGIAAHLTQQYPASNTGVGARVMSLRDQTTGDVQPTLLLLLGLVGFVLLMVCANIGNLLLARASAREREFAVRAALGAGRGRVLRQLLTESVLLALLGGVAGLLLASWGISALRTLAPASLPQATGLSLDASVGAFNFAVACLAGLACGLAPAWHAERHDLHAAIKSEARGSSHRSAARARNLLVVAETALGVVVLVGAGLLLRSFRQLQNVAVGFESDRVLTFRVALPAPRYGALQKRTAFYRELVDRLGAMPRVQSAGGISFLPLTLSGRSTGINVEGDPPPAPGEVKFVDFRSVTPGYFATLRIPIIEGRDVAWSDMPDAPAAIVVSQAAARAFWPNRDAIGRRIKLGSSNNTSIPWLTVVGVVGNVHQFDLVRQPRPAIYLAGSQDPGTGDTVRDWVVRTAGDPAALAPAARSAVWAVDGALPITRLQPLDRVRAAATGREQFTLLLVTLFAVLALVLAAVGLYGVTAYAVAQRTRELGIRVALGATSRDVVRLVLDMGGRLVLVGLAIGTLAALMLSRLMSTLLFGVSARDPMTFAGVALLLAAVSMVACYIPARRATRVDPVIALRE